MPRLTLKQRLRDPAKRARLPMSALPPKMAEQRRLNRRKLREDQNPLYDPSAQLSGHRLASAARQVANQELEPQIGAVDRQLASHRTQAEALTSRARDYYTQLANREREGIARQQSIGEALRSQLEQTDAAKQNDLNQQVKQATERRQQDEATRGAGLQGSDQASAELAAARGRSDLQSQQAQENAARETGDWASLSNALSQARQLRGGELQQSLANRDWSTAHELMSKRADLEAQRGPATTKALLDLRNNEFENAATIAGLDIKRSDLVQQATDARANRRVKLSGIRATARTNRANRRSREDIAAENRRIEHERVSETHRHNVVQESKPAKQDKESAASLKMRRDISAARGTWRRLMTKFGGDERHVKKHMIEVMGVPPAAYNAVYDLERSGSLHPSNAKALADDLGVMVPTGWKRRVRRTAASKAPH